MTEESSRSRRQAGGGRKMHAHRDGKMLPLQSCVCLGAAYQYGDSLAPGCKLLARLARHESCVILGKFCRLLTYRIFIYLSGSEWDTICRCDHWLRWSIVVFWALSGKVQSSNGQLLFWCVWILFFEGRIDLQKAVIIIISVRCIDPYGSCKLGVWNVFGWPAIAHS